MKKIRNSEMLPSLGNKNQEDLLAYVRTHQVSEQELHDAKKKSLLAKTSPNAAILTNCFTVLRFPLTAQAVTITKKNGNIASAIKLIASSEVSAKSEADLTKGIAYTKHIFAKTPISDLTLCQTKDGQFQLEGPVESSDLTIFLMNHLVGIMTHPPAFKTPQPT